MEKALRLIENAFRLNGNSLDNQIESIKMITKLVRLLR